jgi:hypothetical protein
MRRVLLLALVLVTGALGSPAEAGIIIQTGNVPQMDENILFNEPGLIGTGNPVTGITNQTGLIVAFTSDEILTTPSGGQARVEAVDGAFFTYAFEVPGGTFLSYIFNLNVLGSTQGTATISALDNFGTVLSGNFAVGVGENFFTVSTVDDQRLTRVQVVTDVGLLDVRQNRVGGAALVVPEPATLLLLLGGVAAFAARRRR